MMESPAIANIGSSTGQDEEDRISALPTDLLLRILQQLDLCMLVRTSVLSTRWRHLSHQLPCLDINLTCSHSPVSRPKIMGTYTSATRLTFGDSDVCSLINACHRLEHLSFRSCNLVKYTVLKIDVPCSRLQMLEFIGFRCAWIELISVPDLRRLECHSSLKENPPVRFGYVPQLHEVYLASCAKAWQTPIALGEFMSRIASNLSTLRLNFSCQAIWVRPEHPELRTPIFSHLRDVYFYNIFVDCDLNWTLFILEAAPSLQNFHLSRHSCVYGSEDSDEKTNMVWEPSKNLKHLNLKLLVMNGFTEEDKVMDYVRLVMERAVGLKRIELSNKYMCVKCNALEYPRVVDEATKHRVSEQLTHGFSSAVEIIFG